MTSATIKADETCHVLMLKQPGDVAALQASRGRHRHSGRRWQQYQEDYYVNR